MWYCGKDDQKIVLEDRSKKSIGSSAPYIKVLVYRRGAIDAASVILLHVSTSVTIGELAKTTQTEALYFLYGRKHEEFLTTSDEEGELDRAKDLNGKDLREHYKNACSRIIIPKLKAQKALQINHTLEDLLQQHHIYSNWDSAIALDALMPRPAPLDNEAEGSDAYHSALSKQWQK